MEKDRKDNLMMVAAYYKQAYMDEVTVDLTKPHRAECSAEKSKRQKGRKPFNIFHTEATKLKISLNSAKTRKVIQMDLMGNFIKEWDKIKIAAIELHMHSAGISMCCRGILKQSGGFKWKYSQIRETDKIK